MEPLFPMEGEEVLAQLCVEILKKTGELKASLPSRLVRAEVAQLVRQMNSYYSNLIEGHKTLPRDIRESAEGGFFGTI
ncbi:MAG: hypothetical protein ACI9R3_005892 [Verrucomicrobiales bacterium]|jgi:hypothetical protein